MANASRNTYDRYTNFQSPSEFLDLATGSTIADKVANYLDHSWGDLAAPNDDRATVEAQIIAYLETC